MISKKPKKIFGFLFILLFLAYLFLLGRHFLDSLANINFTFGYVDYQSNWRVLEDFLSLRTPFKDYYHSYGLFFMFLQAPAFIAFGGNFLALLISRDLYLPLIGIGISYFIAKKILIRNPLIFIFMFLALLFGVNSDYTSVRHLVAELSLSLFLLSLFRKEKSGFLSGLIAGLALLTALEYGVALNLTVGFLFILLFLVAREKRQLFALFKKFLLGEVIVLFPFLVWLFFSDSLVNYWNFTFGFINNFYYLSPCGEGFPRLGEISSLRLSSPLLIFGLPILFLQKLNLYLNIVFLLITGFVSLILFVKEKYFSKRNFLKIGLVIYGLLISIRTLDTPCLGYFSYSLIPSLLLIAIWIGEIISWAKQKKPVLKALGFSVVLMILSWLILTENTGYLVKIFGKEKQLPKESFEKTFYPPAGWLLRSSLVKDYQQVTDYIVKNTDKNDYLYVYPWGPYNQTTGRRSPTGANNSLQLQIVGERLINLTQRELVQKKPQLMVINISYNNLGIVHYGETRGDVSRYYALEGEEGPVFLGEGDPIQRFILENYQTVYHNDLAIVMAQRKTSTVAKAARKEIAKWQPGDDKIKLQLMEKSGDNNYKITGKNASWSLTLDKPIKATDVEIEFKLDGDFLTKHLTRYFLNISAWDDGDRKLGESRVLARKTWQKEGVLLTKLEKIKSLKIEIADNAGLVWWFNPYRLAIKGASFYEYIP